VLQFEWRQLQSLRKYTNSDGFALSLWPGIASRYSVSLPARGSGDQITVDGKVFRTCPDRPCDPPGPLYNGYRFSFPGVKWPGAWRWPPTSYSAQVKERAKLYLYLPPVSSWQQSMGEICCAFGLCVNSLKNTTLKYKYST
jgi:hypothetical protein